MTNPSEINEKIEKIPLFDKYYYDHYAFGGTGDLGWHYLKDGLNEFMAAVANFKFHVYSTRHSVSVDLSFELE